MPRRNNDEHHLIQVGIVDWYDLRYGDGLLIAIPNGGKRDARTGAKLKREGVRAGVWDLFLMRPDHAGIVHFCGLWMEIKLPWQRTQARGGLTEKQVRFGQLARANGHLCEVVYYTQDGIDVISRYLKGA